MADPTPLALAKAFSALCAALTGVKSAYHYMPEEYEGLPAVAMLPRRVRQDDVFTGPATENVWTWAVHIVLPLGGLATKAATLEDLGEEPDLDEDAGQLVKILELTATTAEV